MHQRATEKLSKTTNGVKVSWQRIALEENAETEVGAELCAQVGVRALSKGMMARNPSFLKERPEFRRGT